MKSSTLLLIFLIIMDQNLLPTVINDVVESWIDESILKNADDALSTSNSSSDDENQLRHRNSIKNYVEEVVPNYSDVEFQRHFRLTRQVAYDLIEQFKNTEYLPQTICGPNISHECALLFTIWYLANTETFRQCSDRFDMPLSSTHRYLHATVNFIESLSNQYIIWPTTDEALAKKTAAQFRIIHQFNGVIGAIDGSYIRIRRPMKHQIDYVNRKGFHSIILQGTVNRNMLFTDVYIGEPGSLHDARVLRKSPLYEKAMEDPAFMAGYYLLGDSAYPNLPWLVTPFKNNTPLNEMQKRFNSRHSSTRVVLENAFGLLKQRFRRLQSFNNLRMDLIVKCVMAACILHNICILKSRSRDDDNNSDIENDIAIIAEDVNVNRRDQILNAMFGNE